MLREINQNNLFTLEVSFIIRLLLKGNLEKECND